MRLTIKQLRFCSDPALQSSSLKRICCFSLSRKDLITSQIQAFITVVGHFSYRKEFNTKLCARLLPFVDNPPLSVIVRMNICEGQLCYVRMAQIRKSAEDEDIPVDARSVVGKFDVHDGLQFRSGQITSVGVFELDMEPGERIDGNPAVEGLQQQAAIIAHTQESFADLFGRDIQIPVAETLALLTDIGLDIFQLLVDALRFETFAGSLVGFGIPERGTNGEFATELRHRTIVMRPITGT